MVKRSWRSRVKTFLAIFWFLLTFSIVAWWLTYSLQRPDLNDASRRMFAWEGGILLAAVLIGGGTMVVLTFKDEKRQQRLQFFFSTFSHDIKTSITRLRLQAEILEEETGQIRNPILKRLLQDIARLDLQLENSLLLANSNTGLYLEELPLSQIVNLLRPDFDSLKIDINQDAIIKADKRALLSILRNLASNSVLHGHADHLRIKVSQQGSGLNIAVQDNGLGYKGDIHKLGEDILRSENRQGNGLGLLLCRKLAQKMHGELRFTSDSQGFSGELSLPGRMS